MYRSKPSFSSLKKPYICKDAVIMYFAVLLHRVSISLQHYENMVNIFPDFTSVFFFTDAKLHLPGKLKAVFCIGFTLRLYHLHMASDDSYCAMYH